MEETKLDVQIRSEIGGSQITKLRHQNFVPAIVYGENKKPTPIKVEKGAYEKITRAHHGANILFHLNVMEGGKKLRDYSAIVREEQHDPVDDHLVHIDFQRIALDKEIEVEVKIVPKGDAIGVKKDNGSIDQPLHELDIICLPTNIPQQIEVDVTQMLIGDAVHVRDLRLPAGVRTKHDPDSIVLSIVPPMKEEVAPAASIEPEVIGEKKPAEGEAPAAAAEAKPEAKAKEKEAKKEDKK
jgi:large subunit ribosomal protein L25